MDTTIRVATCNFELNGNGDAQLRERLHQRLRDLELDVLMRQEMLGFGVSGRESLAWLESQQAVGMRGQLGPGKGATALYWNSETFTPHRNWENEVGETWMLPPTTLSLHETLGTFPIAGRNHPPGSSTCSVQPGGVDVSS